MTSSVLVHADRAPIWESAAGSEEPRHEPLLRRRRRQKALGVHHIAAELGVHPTTISRWERRDRFPGPHHVHALARVLDLSVSDVAAFFDSVRVPDVEARGVRGHGLRPLRRAAGLSAHSVAAAAGVPVHSVYNWELGTARMPDQAVHGVADLMGLNPDGLVALLRTAPPPPPTLDGASPLRRLRHRAGLSQSVVAERIGHSRHALGGWERGAEPPLVALRRLAAVYGVPTEVVARAARVQPPTLLDRRCWKPGTIHDVLTVMRQWQGLTQRDVADLTGSSTAAVRTWEAGLHAPSPAALQRLERAYGLEPGALLATYPRR